MAPSRTRPESAGGRRRSLLRGRDGREIRRCPAPRCRWLLMCGIAGVVDDVTPPDPSLAEAMGAVLRHRGPDESGHYADQKCALAIRRLAIQDVVHGQQPAFNEDRTIAV